jgi:histidine triad (HIT) family protein
MNSDCVFCRIIRGEIKAEKVYEDDLTLAFKDANPASPIHILIVPKEHIPTLNDIKPGDMILAHIGSVARRIAADLGVADSGYRFFINVNRGGGQVVFHLHAHLVSGHDMGSVFIKAGIAASVKWRKMKDFFKKK